MHECRIADPHQFNADPDTDPSFHFNADTHPAHQSDTTLRLRATDPPRLHFEPPRLQCELHGSIFEPLLIFGYFNADPEQAFHFNAIRIQLSDIMQIHADPDTQPCTNI